MKTRFEKGSFEDVDTDVLIVPCMKGRVPGWAQDMLKGASVEKDFDGSGEKDFLLPVSGKRCARLLLLGLGKEEKAKLESFREAGGRAYSIVAGKRISNCALWITEQMEMDRGCAAQAFVEGFVLKSLKFDIYKTRKDENRDGEGVDTLVVVADEDISRAVKDAVVFSEAQNYVRLLDVEPANIMTPQKMADEALLLAKKYGMDCRAYSRGELEKKGMGGILAVAQGSAQDPVLVRMVHNKDKDLPHIILVGKAITFDSGGISLKPGKGMASMKYDKSGALVLMGVMKAIAELKLPVKATLVFGATENMPGGNAIKPGDVITAFNGKTIEIINTDAEGRLCLADGVAYAASKKPDLILDVATLTGAANIILGRHGICMMGTDEASLGILEKCGNETYERVWPLPLWEEYSEMMKSDIADVKNLGNEQGEASTVTAGAFIKEFVGETPWVHLDIASVDLIEHPNAYLLKGPAGKGVRLISSFVREWAQKK